MRARPKQTCRNCHFLAEYNLSANGAKPRGSWPVDGRSHLRSLMTPWLVPGCYMQVWKLRGHTLGDSLSSDIAREDLSGCLDQDRKGDCFFFEAKEGGMSLEGCGDIGASPGRAEAPEDDPSNLHLRAGSFICGDSITPALAVIQPDPVNVTGLTELSE